MKKKGFIIVIALLLVVIGAYFVSGIYARYTENVTREGTATVAKWAFTTDNPTGNLTINLAENYDEKSLASGKIAPGTKGSFDIALSNGTTETAVDVVATINKENVPKNLKFYTNEGCTDELPAAGLTATLAANDSTGLTKTIYWKWAYDTDESATTDDEDDTTDGKAAKTMTIIVSMTGTQREPGTATISSSWN